MNICKAGDELVGVALMPVLLIGLWWKPAIALSILLAVVVLWPRQGLCQTIAWWVADRR